MEHKIFLITNENVSQYNKIYEFKDKRVLSVLGSGDQYLTCVLNGAKIVDVYDINVYTWYFLNLKIAAINVLDYDSFFKFYIEKELDDYDIYQKVRPFLSEDVLTFFDNNFSRLHEYFFLLRMIFTKILSMEMALLSLT